MKTNNRQLHMEWIAGAAALFILILLLSSCTGKQPETPVASTPETTAETTPTEVTLNLPSEAVPEAALPSEAETEPTQATEAEEASGSVSGITVDLTHTSDEILALYPSIEDFGEKPEEDDSDDDPVEVPAPGTQKNPYVEMLAGYPAQVLSVNIPAGESASYLILGSAGTVVTVDAPAITLSQGEEPAPASETDTAALNLGDAVVDPVIRLSNTGTEAMACTVSLVEALGIKTNPEPVTDPDRIAVKLVAGDMNGHHYLWTASVSGQLTLSTESEILEIMLPDHGELLVPAAEGPENIVIQVEEGDKLLIHAMAVPGEDGLLPEVEAEILLQCIPDQGTAENPEELDALGALALPEGSADHWFSWVPDLDGVLSITADPALYRVTLIDTNTENAGENGSVSLDAKAGEQVLIRIQTVQSPDGVMPVSQSGLMAAFEPTPAADPDTPLPGTEAQPIELDSTAEMVACIPLDPGQTLYFSARAEGMLLTLTGTDMTVLRDGAAYAAQEGRVVQFLRESETVFAVRSDAAETQMLEMVFSHPLGREENPLWLEMADQVTIPAGKTMYCTAKADGMVMTLEGADLSVVHNGKEYLLEEGVLAVPCQGASAFEPPVFAITNKGETDAVCSISFEYPLGHFMNPVLLELGVNTATVGEGGCYFQWTATCSGSLTITMGADPDWEYAINNLTTGVNGEIFSSKTVPAASSQTVEAAAGDEIQLIFHSKEAALEFTAVFVPKPAAEAVTE